MLIKLNKFLIDKYDIFIIQNDDNIVSSNDDTNFESLNFNSLAIVRFNIDSNNCVSFLLLLIFTIPSTMHIH
jgi:hypothetical protein